VQALSPTLVRIETGVDGKFVDGPARAASNTVTSGEPRGTHRRRGGALGFPGRTSHPEHAFRALHCRTLQTSATGTAKEPPRLGREGHKALACQRLAERLQGFLNWRSQVQILPGMLFQESADSRDSTHSQGACLSADGPRLAHGLRLSLEGS
jgi:hypothetical protein